MRKFLSLLMAFVLLSCTANASAAAAGGYETLRDLISSTIEDEGDANTATGYNMGCSALIVSIPKGELILFGEGKKGEIVCTEWKIDNDTLISCCTFASSLTRLQRCLTTKCHLRSAMTREARREPFWFPPSSTRMSCWTPLELT